MAALKGKVVVVDFWATWCGPCVAEMPTMKKLYAEYHGQGVEFLGISLDQPKEQGGLDALKKFVKEKEIPWPQYYQGKGWQSDFSSSWGINSIPSMFLVDQDGKLALRRSTRQSRETNPRSAGEEDREDARGRRVVCRTDRAQAGFGKLPGRPCSTFLVPRELLTQQAFARSFSGGSVCRFRRCRAR